MDLDVNITSQACEYEFESVGVIYEQVDLVIQVYPFSSLLNTESGEAGAEFAYRETIVESNEEGVIPEPGSVDFTEITDHSYIDDKPVGFRVGIEIESGNGVNIMAYDETTPVMYYTNKQTGEIDIAMSRDVTSWETDDGFEIFFCHRINVDGNPTGNPELNTVLHPYWVSVSHEVMNALDEINSGSDPFEYKQYLETKDSSIGTVEYLERPIFEEIAAELQSAFDQWGVTSDSAKVYSVWHAVSGTDYKQDWNTLEEGLIVPYPEQFFYQGYGDCKAMGYAVNGILHHLGFDTSVILYSKKSRPDRLRHHLSGGVGMSLDNEMGDDFEEKPGYRHPEYIESEGAEDHVIVDPSTGRIGNYSLENDAFAKHYVEGKAV